MIRYCLVFALGLLGARAFAGDGCCHCGCESGCYKVCRLVCEMKEETKISYGCKCEDFCVPKPSCRCGVTTVEQCDGRCVKQPNYVPQGASLHTRKVLVKHEEKVLKPSYRWVVETVCPQCAEKQAPQPVAPPPVPSADDLLGRALPIKLPGLR